MLTSIRVSMCHMQQSRDILGCCITKTRKWTGDAGLKNGCCLRRNKRQDGSYLDANIVNAAACGKGLGSLGHSLDLVTW